MAVLQYCTLLSHEAERGRGPPLLPPAERQWGNTFPTFSSSSLFDFIFPFPQTIRNYFSSLSVKKRWYRRVTINVTIKVVSVYPLNNNFSPENDQFETNRSIISLHRNSRNLFVTVCCSKWQLIIITLKDNFVVSLLSQKIICQTNIPYILIFRINI